MPWQKKASKNALQDALEEWSKLLGPERVMDGETATRSYGFFLTGDSLSVAATLFPENTQEVSELVKVAARHKIPIFAYTRDYKWLRIPVADGCVAVDFSRMNKILKYDRELGLAVLEPGVTYGQLYEFLEEKHARHFSPISFRPDLSVLGHTLARVDNEGTDHFANVVSIEAVLPDGVVYRSPLSPSDTGINVLKWGVGSYLDGLFSQSNFGIVTRMTLSLPHRVSRIEYIGYETEEDKFDAMLCALFEIKRTMPYIAVWMNLSNSTKLLSMTGEPYPFDRVRKGSAIPREILAELSAKHDLPDWRGSVTMHCEDKKISRAAHAYIEERLAPVTTSLTHVTSETIEKLQKLHASASSKAGERRKASPYYTLEERLRLASGGGTNRRSNEWVYWKSKLSKTEPPQAYPDDWGFCPYIARIPLKSSRMKSFIDSVKETCIAFGLDPLITVAVEGLCMHLIVFLMFNRMDKEEITRWRTCEKTLIDVTVRMGGFPYHLGSLAAKELFVRSSGAYWNLMCQLKNHLDPENILGPIA